MASGTDKALKLLKTLPRVALNNLRPNIKTKHKKHKLRFRYSEDSSMRLHNLAPLGVERGFTPFYEMTPKEPYYKDFENRRQLPYLTLQQLQRAIDVGFVDTSQPIDLTTVSLAPGKPINPTYREFGYNLSDEGADIFVAKINLEVQHASELAIAAIERNGGTIVTKYYDLQCVEAMVDPEAFFKKGIPIPINRPPPQHLIKYYRDPKNRGYLADPAQIDEARFELAQKYGYTLPNIEEDEDFKMLVRRKRPDQIWFGLEPGWVVNLTDKTVLKPRDPEAEDYYQADHIYGGSLTDLNEIEQETKMNKLKDSGTEV